MRNIWKHEADATRCDWAIRQARQVQIVPTTVLPDPVSAQQAEVPLIQQPVIVTARRAPTTCLTDLARRSPMTTDNCRKAYTVDRHQVPLHTQPKDMRLVQDEYNKCLSNMYYKCCPKFWLMFLSVHKFPVNVIDTMLATTKRAFLEKNSEEWKQFPPSRRRFLEKTGSGADFWPLVKHSCRINLTGVTRKPLASGTQSLTFEFLDPVWAWLCTASRLPPQELHWKPAAQNPDNPKYGGGIQYGKCFRQACLACPPGGYPMCISLHWDGTSGGGISSDPICIGVMNTNNCGAETQCCIGYMPHAPDYSRPEFCKTTDFTKIKFHIRQECCRAILRVIQNVTRRGIVCTLPNRLNHMVDRLLFPRLVSMNFDQPEARLFYGNLLSVLFIFT